MRTLNRYFPVFVKKYDIKLRSIIMSDFDKIFPTICAIDYYSIAGSFQSISTYKKSSSDKRDVTLSKESIELANSIKDEVSQLIITNLRNLIDNKDVGIVDIGKYIICKYFDKWKLTKYSEKQLSKLQPVDAYNFMNNLQYSGMKYENWPRWARLDEIEKHLGKLKMSDVIKNFDKISDFSDQNTNMEYLSEKMVDEQEKLDGKPTHTASSWLDD